MEDLATRILEAARQNEDAIRRAHEATRDLTTARRELDEAVKRAKREIDQYITGKVGELIEKNAKEQLSDFGTLVQAYIKKSTNKIIEEFDDFAAHLLGPEFVASQKAKGKWRNV